MKGARVCFQAAWNLDKERVCNFKSMSESPRSHPVTKGTDFNNTIEGIVLLSFNSVMMMLSMLIPLPDNGTLTSYIFLPFFIHLLCFVIYIYIYIFDI